MAEHLAARRAGVTAASGTIRGQFVACAIIVGVKLYFRYEAVMQFQNIVRAIACAALVCLAAGCSKETQAEPAQRTAEDVLTGMRLKSLTKDLDLTAEQKNKVKALFDEEGKEIAKIRADANLSITQQAIKIGELKKETHGKIKPLLTPAQAEKFEQMLSKSEKRKRRN